MALQTSGPISLLNVQGEFGGSNPIGINEYYGADSGVPTSGTISLNNFYGKTAFQPEVYTFTKSTYYTGGKLGDDIVFNAPAGLTNAERIRSVGFSYYSGTFSPSQLTFIIRSFQDANGYIGCWFLPSILHADGSATQIAANTADFDPWWRYTRVYQGSTLLYQFDRQNVRSWERDPAASDNNASDGIMQWGESSFDSPNLVIQASTPNLSITMSDV